MDTPMKPIWYEVEVSYVIDDLTAVLDIKTYDCNDNRDHSIAAMGLTYQDDSYTNVIVEFEVLDADRLPSGLSGMEITSKILAELERARREWIEQGHEIGRKPWEAIRDWDYGPDTPYMMLRWHQENE